MCNNSLYKSSLSVNGSRLWNKLPLEIRNKKTFSAFKYNLKLYMANNQTMRGSTLNNELCMSSTNMTNR